jgi:TPP-dependent pyruvate/acetoin dehydrogenase alpha subunit
MRPSESGFCEDGGDLCDAGLDGGGTVGRKARRAMREAYPIGRPLGKVRPPPMEPKTARLLIERMALVRAIDDALIALQRAGTLASYSSLQGEEGAIVGACLALEAEDTVFPTPREALAAVARGWPVEAMLLQALGKAGDAMQGRQPPGIVTARAVNVAPAATLAGVHIVQAAGWGWASRMKKDARIALAFLGDGATSSADFHTGLNFAGVFKAKVVFVCRNNGFASSTPVARQTRTETLAEKAVAYGLPSDLCDGNDAVAVHAAVRRAAARARSGGGATLVEVVTTRLEVDPARCPIARLHAALSHEDATLPPLAELLARPVALVADALAAASRAPDPPRDAFLSNVYAT